MRAALILYVLFLISIAATAQSNDKWIAFKDDSGLIGFKDITGEVKIKPKFMGLTTAKYFHHIIIAMEEGKNGTWDSYYLTKLGKIVGRDSLHTIGNVSDCESEGFIRFRDRKTNKVGMLNKEGDIVIPAEYNALSRVQNGLIHALQRAKKEPLNHLNHSGSKYYSWQDGKQILLDTNNKIIIENFKNNSFLNLYSMQIEEEEASNIPYRISFKGISSKYYSFIDYRKEFKHWLHMTLLNSFTLDKIIKKSYDNITYYKNDWKSEDKADFIKRNFEGIKNSLLRIKNPDSNYLISTSGLNPYIFDNKEFKKYYDNCGDSLENKYPVMSIIISIGNKSDLKQEHFNFLRTDNGYRLISLRQSALVD